MRRVLQEMGGLELQKKTKDGNTLVIFIYEISCLNVESIRKSADWILYASFATKPI